MKRPASFVVALAVPLFVALATSPAQAEEQPAVDIHGFGGWAAGNTSNDNLYPDVPFPIASHDTEVDNYYFTLNLVARPTDKVLIHAQPTWQSSMQGKRMQLDLAYVELTVAKDLRVRVGQIRNPLGLYTAIAKVGTLRPFYLLPNVYYRLAPEGYAGLGLNRVQRLGSWELELDLLGGQMNFEPTETDLMVGFNPVAKKPVYASLSTVIRGRDVVGGGALLRLPVKGLQFGVSAYSMKLYGGVAGGALTRLADDRQKAYAGSLEYLTDKISLRSEVLSLHGYEVSDAWYAEAAYHLTSHWQVAGMYEYLKVKEPPALTPSTESLKEHHAVGFGLNYWYSPKLVWKLDYYRASGNRVARPGDAVNRALAGTIEKETDVLIVGAHFSF
jgi:hypothetical protein